MNSNRWTTWFASAGFAAVLGMLLALPSLRVGLIFDDYHHKLVMQNSDSPARIIKSPFALFSFLSGNPEETQRLIDFGFCPWWTYPGIKGAFFRPLASLTHWIDYRLWPDTPALMHAQSILWYGALLLAVGLLYRRFMGAGSVAGLAGLMYAIDDAHAMPITFLANRNALMAAVFGTLALMAHDHWRRDRSVAGMVLGPILLVAALLSAEAGTGVLAYLLAYALFLDNANWRVRIASLVPYGIVVVAWRCIWSGLGYGVANMGLYVDPLGDPGQFIRDAVQRIPALLLGQLGGIAAEIHMILPALSPALCILGVLLTLLIGWVLRNEFRQDRVMRFWAVGMLLSVLPVCATVAADRLLLFTGIGAMALLVRLIVMALGSARASAWSAGWRKPIAAFAWILVVVHLVIAPLLLPLRAGWPMGLRSITGELWPASPMDESIRQKDLVIVNPPLAFFTIASPLIWACDDQPLPRHLRTLTSSCYQPVEICRTDANTLVISPDVGYVAGAMDGLFRTEKHPLTLGQVIQLPGMTVTITAIHANQRVTEAAFRFDVPLEDSSLYWLQWKDKRFVPFTPPAIGETVILK